MRVLLVDDELELVSTVAERLTIRGIDADWSTSSEEALKKIQGKAYDVAILDVKMPKVSGLDLKKMMQKIRPEMKYIFITGHGSEEDFKAGSAEAGAKYYLLKPVNIEDLIKKIHEILGN